MCTVVWPVPVTVGVALWGQGFCFSSLMLMTMPGWPHEKLRICVSLRVCPKATVSAAPRARLVAGAGGGTHLRAHRRQTVLRKRPGG